MTKIKFIVGKTATGFDAYSEINENIVAVTTGGNLIELKTNALEAYNVYLEEKRKSGITVDQLKFEFAPVKNTVF